MTPQNFLLGTLLLSLAVPCLAEVKSNDAQPTVRVAMYKGDREAALSFTLDDGWEDAASIGAPLFDRYGIHATFFLVSGLIPDDAEHIGKSNYGKVPWPRWREIAAKGHELGNHSFDHAMNFTDADDEKLHSEIAWGYQRIKEKTGIAPVSFALPSSNQLNAWTQRVVDEYHPVTRVHITGYGGKKCTVESANALIDKAIQEKKWTTTLFHAIENGYDAFSSAAVLEGHLSYVQGLQDRLWIDTFGNVGRYVKEREAAKLDVTHAAANGVTFTLTTPLDAQRFCVPLTVVIEAPGASAVKANRAGETVPLPVTVKNDKVMVDVVPGTVPVTVTWTSSGIASAR